MPVWILIFALMIAVVCVAASSANNSPSHVSSQTGKLQPNTLCAHNERIIFSCPIKSPAKIVSICASKDLASDNYNGEEKPAVSRQGVTVNQPGTQQKEVSFVCRTKPKTNYSDLQAVLPSGRAVMN